MVIIKLELEEFKFEIFLLGNLVYNPASSIFDIKGTLTLKAPEVVPLVIVSPSFTSVTSGTSTNVSVFPLLVISVTRL